MSLGHGDHPLAHLQRREDVINQVRGSLGRSPGVAGRTQLASLAGEGHQEIAAARRVPRAGEAIDQDAAGEIVAEFPFQIGGHPLTIPVSFARQRELGLQVVLYDLVKGCALRTATGIRTGSPSLCGDGHIGATVRSRD